MPRAQRGFPSRQSRSRRSTSWGLGPGGTVLTSVSASSAGFVGSGVIATVEGLTLIRTRGRFNMFMAGAGSSDGDGMQGAFGIGIAQTVAVDAGIASVSTPITNQADENWIYWTPLSVHNGDVSIGLSPQVQMNFEVDSKAMRKIPVDVTLYAAFELVEIGAGSVSLFFDSRILVKNP